MSSAVTTPRRNVNEGASVEPSTPPTSAPDSDDEFDFKPGNVNEDDNEKLMLDIAGVSSSVREEEERYKDESKKADAEEEVKKTNTKAEDFNNDAMFKQLQTLIKKSTMYSSFLLEKLTKQQEEARARAEKLDKEGGKGASSTKSTKRAAEPSKKSTRQSGAASASDNKKDESKAPAKRGRGRPAAGGAAAASKTKHGTFDVSKYFSKKDLSTMAADAAAAAEEESSEDEGFGAKVTKSARQPDLVSGAVMKEYQLQGLEWLVSLYENGLNGILADEMGLGKTIQTIAFLAFLKEKKIHGPFLVAAPLSTLSNWVDEFERFAPDIPTLLYHGTPPERAELREKRLKRVDANFPVVCTSYEIIMRDTKYLQKMNWKYIIIDEGHRLKNLNSRLIRELKSYGSDNRLLLTGTPLQNNLAELWSLLNFLMPNIFDNLETFESWFDFSALREKEGHNQILEKEEKSKIVSSLHQILKPFLLRRVKTDVLLNLPKKREYVLYAPLSKTQKELYLKLTEKDAEDYLVQKVIESYKHVSAKAHSTGSSSGSSTPNKHKRKASENLEAVQSLQPPKKGAHKLRDSRSSKKMRVSYKEESDRAYFKKLEDATEPETPKDESKDDQDPVQKAIDQATKEVRKKKMQNVIMQLRLACNSPHMFYWPWGDGVPDETLVTESGKMMLLDRLVPALFKKGHKVLIFSQFTKQLDVIQDWAELLRGWRVCRIDGAVKQEDRREQIKAFNSDASYKLFLLSTRAGGLGINLAAADTVILFDSDWNPQQDLQAQDRAHRIGQTKPVIIYRLATSNTIEQTLLEKADAKRRLEKLVIQKGKFKSLTTTSNQDDLSELMKILKVKDFENINVEDRGEEILSDEDLKIIMDRSPAAYERAEKGETVESSVFKAVETKKASEDDILAAI